MYLVIISVPDSHRPGLGLDFNNEDAANEASVLPTSK
jgi:hypothetical protein